MQISRHWRLNAQRYRLEGIRYTNGVVDLQNRPEPIRTASKDETLVVKENWQQNDGLNMIADQRLAS